MELTENMQIVHVDTNYNMIVVWDGEVEFVVYEIDGSYINYHETFNGYPADLREAKILGETFFLRYMADNEA